MLLAQLKLQKGDNQGAITVLQDLSGKLSTGPNAAAVRGLLGDAYSQSGKPAEAAAEYERAAGVTQMPNEKAYLLSKAGHSYMTAGKQPEARRIWESLATNQDSPGLAAEARVRLGELVASPAKG
jgi:Flp pilus assembly protein TadD